MTVRIIIFDLAATGVSGDTKPALADGGLFFEEDTGKIFTSIGGVYTENLNPSYSRAGSIGSGWVAEDGVDGERGPPGLAGAAGTPGTSGAAGLQGPPGLDGADGVDGEAGPPGAAGATGTAGTPGATGAQGPPILWMGEDGDEGARGPPGPAGAAGTSGGGGSATTVEVNLGSALVFEGKATITDATITPSSKVLGWQAPGPYTGKGTRADEAIIAPIEVVAVAPAAGSAILHWRATGSYVPQTVTANGGADTLTGVPLDNVENLRARAAEGPANRRGRVRGNVKFSYVVFA